MNPQETEIEVPCRVCNGDDDTCTNCEGCGIETLTGSDARQYQRDERESFEEDFKEQFEKVTIIQTN